MEIICRIADQGPVQEREYTTQQGMKDSFASMPFILQSGDDSFFCEMVQEQARKQARQEPLSRDYYYKATVAVTARPWQDQQGQTRYENRLTLTRLAVL